MHSKNLLKPKMLSQWGFPFNFSQVGSTCSPIHTEHKNPGVPRRTLHLMAVRNAHRPPNSRVKQPCDLLGKTSQRVVGKCQKLPAALSVACATSYNVVPVAAYISCRSKGVWLLTTSGCSAFSLMVQPDAETIAAVEIRGTSSLVWMKLPVKSGQQQHWPPLDSLPL